MTEPRVLIVEDDELTATRYQVALAERFEAIVAPTVAQARALLVSEPFDLVIIDLFLPDGSGVELVRDARPLLPDLPFMLVSGASIEAIVAEARKTGTVVVFPKPTDIADLVATALRMVGR